MGTVNNSWVCIHSQLCIRFPVCACNKRRDARQPILMDLLLELLTGGLKRPQDLKKLLFADIEGAGPGPARFELESIATRDEFPLLALEGAFVTCQDLPGA